ncbi:unnamed protein product [Notodromas monacha]|uniref:Glycoside hydrolase family 5 domain-containing protein n=1 Tax=Notodromas monacha TaxID=399045 RepID=A0A7R9BWL9_9CRUS|nr:unnamed protein product [Notodromas monacha]CAG0923127.1 unnamed protein product [Notodromas monacha]
MLQINLSLLCISLFFINEVSSYLEARGDGLYYGGQKVFLSGANYAWHNYGQDFGDGHYFSESQAFYERWLDEIASAGGNSVRFWLHVEGYVTPKFDANGYVISGDNQGTLKEELKTFLDAARQRNIFVVPVLWNGAYLTNQNAINLVWDESKLQSYIDNALKPLVSAVSNHPALAAWEIVNEPEGSIRVGVSNSNPCFDTTPISNSGAGWTGLSIPIENWLKFINRQIDAIRSVDPAMLATQGAWSERSQTNVCADCHNYFSDDCLIAAGGRPGGTIDFYQMHTYSWQSQYSPYSPLKVL